MSASALSESDRALVEVIAGRPLPPLEPADLARLPASAAAHGLSAYVLRRAEEDGLALPQRTLAALREEARSMRTLRSMLDLELHRLSSGAPPGSPTAVVLKGPAVARHWPDPGLRPYVDIDLLVPEEDLDDWGAALIRLGYRAPAEADRLSARLAHHHVVYTRGLLTVELHWRLFAAREAAGLDHGTLSAHARPQPGVGGFLMASRPAELVVLGVHLAHHAPAKRKLVWLLDFVLLGTSEAVGAARELADGWGVRWALEAALADTEEALGEPRWNAVRPRITGLPAARMLGAGSWRTRLAKARTLGLRTTWRYGMQRIKSLLRNAKRR